MAEYDEKTGTIIVRIPLQEPYETDKSLVYANFNHRILVNGTQLRVFGNVIQKKQ